MYTQASNKHLNLSHSLMRNRGLTQIRHSHNGISTLAKKKKVVFYLKILGFTTETCSFPHRITVQFSHTPLLSQSKTSPFTISGGFPSWWWPQSSSTLQPCTDLPAKAWLSNPAYQPTLLYKISCLQGRGKMNSLVGRVTYNLSSPTTRQKLPSSS